MSTTAQAPAAAAAVAPSSSSSSSSSSLGGGGGGSTNTTSTLKSLDDYCLRVSAGPAPTAGGFLAVVNVNDETRPLLIDSEHFTGHLVVRMQNFNGLTPPPHSSTSSSSSKNNAQQQQPIRHPASGYFHGRQRKYSIVVQGRFHRAHSGADVVFGIETDSPVRTPAGTSLALKIAKWLDPSLQADLACLRPWIQSPLLAAVNAFTVFPATELDALEERCSRSRSRSPQNAHHDGDKERKEDRAARSAQNARRKRYFAGDAGRALLSRVVLDPRNVYAMDFYDSYFDYSTVTIKLPGFSINAFRFWDGQPLRYRAKTRDGSVVFFEVVVELVERAGLSGGAVSV
ncbi:hypothetical protein DFJ73DRAFT_631050 [Zopfochytrium polystomum]|nr:hypothetical protein DFJ73DRAFT_631050 [Zopfochytrium polystomum]